MTMNSKDAYNAALLADAAYADFFDTREGIARSLDEPGSCARNHHHPGCRGSPGCDHICCRVDGMTCDLVAM